MLLADLGADVVKVELPGTGDPFRAFKGGLYSPHYQTVNRNKRSITLNTKQAADLEKFDALVKDADVYIQNFRPGFAEQIGTGFERLRGINDKLIYCAISGFGATGPPRRPTYDSVAQAASGYLRLLVNPPTRAWWARPSPTWSPASTRPTASWARCTSARSAARRARSRCRCSRP
jgi:crotonobetainyl-CoA:carnitine CoA-transferase CaiB-like acyl-CoA transferase